MRLFRARGRSAKADGFKTPIRRRVKLRYIRDALRGRASLIPLRCPLAHRRGIAIPGPFGSANRAASSKPARFFRRWRRFAAFLFPTATASLGCGGGPRFLEKENASRPVEEKVAFCRPTGRRPVGGNAGVFRIGAGKTCRSPTECGVHWLLSGLLRRSSQNPGSHRWVENRKACPPTPAHSASLCATRAVPKERCPAFLNCQGAAAKENGGASGRDHTSGLP